MLVALALLVLVAALAVVAVVRVGDDVVPVPQDEPGPVLLIPGYGGSTASLRGLAAVLEDSGRSVAVLPPVGSGTGDLDEQAEALGRAAERAVDDGAPSVDVVGYSAGGVVARAWVAEHGGGSLARRVLTIGSPHHGTDVARLALEAVGNCPPACRQLVPDSDFLRRLNSGDETPPGPAFVSVWSESDQVVVPTDSARLEGALNLTVQQLCPSARTGHGQLPDDGVVTAAALAALGPGPAEPPEPTC